ncbi:unnamed protein product [Mytilus coruscus]|uniref:Mab-21-like HhH/H2TH-like domain-containing protein n=1 Tax=Mytilus coruscus TaxID=42192 RepID=A0A6J8B5X5_MYTCO|nr:unnamed protein product [Mytilus coruscus]
MTDISRYIYQYMCDEIVRSKTVVKYGRRFIEVFEFVHNNCLSPSKYFVSGSKAEGLDLSGSDLDIMLISNKYIVCESKPEAVIKLLRDSVNKHILIIDTGNAQPGFALLCVQKDFIKTTYGKDSFLCSYFLNMTLFWLSKEVEVTNWTPKNLLDCFVMCLGRLAYWITHKYIPNYFIPEHNMIDRLYNQQLWDE